MKRLIGQFCQFRSASPIEFEKANSEANANEQIQRKYIGQKRQSKYNWLLKRLVCFCQKSIHPYKAHHMRLEEKNYWDFLSKKNL